MQKTIALGGLAAATARPAEMRGDRRGQSLADCLRPQTVFLPPLRSSKLHERQTIGRVAMDEPMQMSVIRDNVKA